jgi:hypothetical protein
LFPSLPIFKNVKKINKKGLRFFFYYKIFNKKEKNVLKKKKRFKQQQPEKRKGKKGNCGVYSTNHILKSTR